MNQKVLYKIFIWGFLVLYLLVAAISFCHAIQFFCIGNQLLMSIMLAFAFELGLALSLAAVLLSDANKKATLPWVLMITLTVVQIIGNVYSVEKFICESNAVYYQYLSNALLFWIEGISEQTVQVIVSWIMGAILPIIALFMTDMVASNIKNMLSLTSGEPASEPVEEYKQEEYLTDSAKKVEVKKIDPVEVQKTDSDLKEQAGQPRANKLNNIFATKIAKEPSNGNTAHDEIVNSPGQQGEQYHRADETFFKKPETN